MQKKYRWFEQVRQFVTSDSLHRDEALSWAASYVSMQPPNAKPKKQRGFYFIATPFLRPDQVCGKDSSIYGCCEESIGDSKPRPGFRHLYGPTTVYTMHIIGMMWAFERKAER